MHAPSEMKRSPPKLRRAPSIANEPINATMNGIYAFIEDPNPFVLPVSSDTNNG
jgi:hypothetical protein